nr:toxin-antitoxin system HicB family antitoxin [uncultured Marvinbryantia sp.]
MADQQKEEKKKWNVPRGAAATRAKNKHRNANYDRGELALPKGMKAKVKEAAQEQGQSFNAYVEQAIKERYLRDTGEEMEWQKEK